MDCAATINTWRAGYGCVGWIWPAGFVCVHGFLSGIIWDHPWSATCAFFSIAVLFVAMSASVRIWCCPGLATYEFFTNAVRCNDWPGCVCMIIIRDLIKRAGCVWVNFIERAERVCVIRIRRARCACVRGAPHRIIRSCRLPWSSTLTSTW